jgi:hypothetical protein
MLDAHWQAALRWLADTRFARRAADAFFRTRSRRHLTGLEHPDAARCQQRILRGLVHRARETRFGRDHDFPRVRTAEDYRRLVPLRTPSELWRAYWQPAFPELAGATWPGPVPYLAEPPGAESPLPPVALSPALCAARAAAFRTALALVVRQRPRTRLFSGVLLFLGSDATVTAVVAGTRLGQRQALGAQGVPGAVRPYARATPGWEGGESSLRDVAARCAGQPVTCLVGPAGRLARLLELVKQAAGCDRLPDAWAGLTAVLYNRPVGAAGGRLRDEVGPDVLLVETGFRPEGPVTVADPRNGLHRLLFDHGVFFEFVPIRETQAAASRHALGEVEVGVPYELAVTTPAGWWACRTGQSVSFERRDPPLLRYLGAAPAAVPAPAVIPVPADRPALPTLPPHPRTADTRAELPGSFARIPWSAPADRG